MKHVTIYTDGGCRPSNPGPGGYGVVLRHGDHVKELSAGFRHTTNNRMEILAAVVALESLKAPCRVSLHSDSQYVINAMKLGWATKWRDKGWQRNKTEKAKNPDLWERLLAAAARHHVEWVWVRGHSGIADNERCDQLATAAAQGKIMAEDEGYQAEGE